MERKIRTLVKSFLEGLCEDSFFIFDANIIEKPLGKRLDRAEDWALVSWSSKARRALWSLDLF